jgi:glycosyltransferase involved in cell wall biosynthesis
MIVGVDGSNLRAGGGVTHLVEILRNVNAPDLGIGRVVVWGGSDLLRKLPQRNWLQLTRVPSLERGPIARANWQWRRATSLSKQNCDIFFAPGGMVAKHGVPTVTMSRNLLPFDQRAVALYPPFSPARARLTALRVGQARSFARADGTIFLTEAARTWVENSTGPIGGEVRVIAHGVADQYRHRARKQEPLASYSKKRPLRLLYVSTISPYKHHAELIKACDGLRRQGIPIKLDLIGPGHRSRVSVLRRMIKAVDPFGSWINYMGAVAYDSLHHAYCAADVFVFPSSCENMPNILLEAMASGLPIASSEHPVMREVLGDGGVFFDPREPQSISSALQYLVSNHELRQHLAERAASRAAGYSWERTARETFEFLGVIANRKG